MKYENCGGDAYSTTLQVLFSITRDYQTITTASLLARDKHTLASFNVQTNVKKKCCLPALWQIRNSLITTVCSKMKGNRHNLLTQTCYHPALEG